MPSSKVTIGLAVALLMTNAAWLYRAIDSAVTIDHHATEVRRQQASVDLMRALMIDYPRDVDASTAYHQVRARYPNLVVKLQGDTVEVGQMKFEYRGAALQRVSTF